MLKLTFCLILLIHFITDVHAQVFSVDCTSQDMHKVCTTKATVVIKGKNLGTWTGDQPLDKANRIGLIYTSGNSSYIKATLKYNEDWILNGPNDVSIPSNLSNKSTFNGTMMFGYLNGLESQIHHFYNGTTLKDSLINSQSTNIIYEGLVFNITGKFNEKKTYEVMFYTNADANNIDYKNLPVCSAYKLTSTQLQCKFSQIKNSDWKYSFVVFDNEANNFVPLKDELDWLQVVKQPTQSSSTESSSTSNSPSPSNLTSFPVITGANGDCVKDNTKCVNDASIEFIGQNIVSDAADKYKVSIEDINNAGCKVSRTTNTSLSCTLFGVNGKKGMFTTTIQIKNKDNSWSEKKREMGTLVINEKGYSGFSLDYIKPPTVIHPTTTKSATVTTALTIVFAILFAVVLIILLVIFLRFKMISRSMWSTIKKQLQDTQVEELRPRTAVRVNNEAMN